VISRSGEVISTNCYTRLLTYDLSICTISKSRMRNL